VDPGVARQPDGGLAILNPSREVVLLELRAVDEPSPVPGLPLTRALTIPMAVLVVGVQVSHQLVLVTELFVCTGGLTAKALPGLVLFVGRRDSGDERAISFPPPGARNGDLHGVAAREEFRVYGLHFSLPDTAKGQHGASRVTDPVR
jgi:hypothetical protein